MWIPSFVLKWIGKGVKDKLDLQEGFMDSKPWYQSKTIWAGVVTGIIGIYNSIATAKGWPPVPDWVYSILAGMGVYSRASATTTIKPS